MEFRLLQYFDKLLTRGHTRSIEAKKNILALFALRATSVATSFLLVPLTINYLNPTQYGIWLTLTSIVGSVSLLDVGLGNGLRNKIAEALALNDKALVRTYVSTAYAAIGIFVVVAIIVFTIINPLLNWRAILNAPEGMERELTSLAEVVFVFFCLRLFFGLVGTVMIADQKPALNSLMEVVANLISLLIIYAMTKTMAGSLLNLGIVISSIVAFVPFVASLWYYTHQYADFRPSLGFAKFIHAKELLSLGLQFFILQVTGILTFSSSNIIITQLLSPQDVSAYNIAFKYFGIVSTLFIIILTPFWTACTDAYVRGDIDWIRRIIKKLVRYWTFGIVLVIIMTIFAGPIYSVWIGNSITISFPLSVAMAAYVLITTWLNIYVYFLNGIGKIRLQIVAALSVGALNIPLAILFAKYFEFGTQGVVLATCACLFPWCIVWPVQVRKLLDRTATGIWSR